MKLEGRVAIVTGAGTGMGQAIAELFAAEGAKVLVNYRVSKAEAEEVVAKIRDFGGDAVTHQADVSQDAEARSMMKAVDERWGRLDTLVNNAGWSKVTPHHQLEELTDEIWDRTLNTNLRGAFYCSRAAVPLLRSQPGGIDYQQYLCIGVACDRQFDRLCGIESGDGEHDEVIGAGFCPGSSRQCNCTRSRTYALRRLAGFNFRGRSERSRRCDASPRSKK